MGLEQEKLDKLRKILKDQIEWYQENIDDEDYVYDEMHEQFASLSRSDFCSIIIILSD